ncbi:PAS domain-containing protein [Myxococcota bacterium]|nr:PAS domain-containing protein [Myxococcota bacterium]
MLDRFSILVVALGRDGRVTRINRRTTEVLGYAEAEIVGRDWFGLVVPGEEAEAARRAFDGLISGGVEPVAHCVTRVRARSGDARRIEWHCAVIPGADGRIDGVLSLGDEGTGPQESAVESGARDPGARLGRRTAELAQAGALLQSEVDHRRSAQARARLFTDVAHHMRVGVVVWCLRDPSDPASFELVHTNPAASQHLSVPIDRALGRRISEVLPSPLASDHAAIYAEVVRTGASRDLGEVRIPGDGPGEGWYLVEAFPLPGRCVGISFTNVTRRREAEEEAWRNATFLDTIVEHIPDMIFLKDARDLRFVRLNRAAEQLLGYDRRELIGRSDFDFFPEEEARFFVDKDREVLRGRAVVDIPEEPIHTALKGVRWLHTKKIPIPNADGSPLYLLGISEDVTERKRAEEAMERQRQELARSNAELDQFASFVSHDLRSPLQLVSVSLEALEEAARVRGDEAGRRLVTGAREGVERMAAMIEDLLAYARVGATRPSRPEVDAEAVLRSVLAELAPQVSAASARITWGPLPTLRAQPVHLAQLFRNLVGNAIKFRSDAPPEVHVSAERLPGAWAFRVRDNGVGVPPGHEDRIFEMFQRAPDSVGRPGSGVGLAICKKVVRLHGGEIGVEPNPSGGAVFRFTIADPEGTEEANGAGAASA